jgi:thiol-disulfide isomerase/thioredoxin
MMRTLILALSLLALPALAAPTFCTDAPEPNAKPDLSALTAIGTPMPLEGRQGWAWINLWATWCAPCVAELGLLHAIEAQLGGPKALRLTLISLDQTAEPLAAFLKAHTLAGTWHAPLGDVRTELIKSLGLIGGSLPTHVFIDPKGAVRCVHEGIITPAHIPAIRARLGLK